VNADAAAWRATLESLPRAHGPPLAQALLKANLEDFLVEETLGFGPDGGRAHWLLRVEKAGLDTLEVARSLARRLRIPVSDVGFAGLKDRRALARQWFTVPAAPNSDALASYTEGSPEQGFRVLEACAHSRKLRRGALLGNRFQIRLRAVTPPVDSGTLKQRLNLLATAGAPNYFGPQRFGRGYSNLERIASWLGGARPAYGREARAFVWSSARALIFNAGPGSFPASSSTSTGRAPSSARRRSTRNWSTACAGSTCTRRVLWRAARDRDAVLGPGALRGLRVRPGSARRPRPNRSRR